MHALRRWLAAVLFAFLVPAGLLGFHTGSAHAAPPGFVVEVVNGGLALPVTIAFAPDGRIFYNELFSGRIRVIENGSVVPTPFAQVSVSSSGERGLMGLALHPDFATNGFVYICFSTPAGGHEIGRFTAVGNTGTAYTPIVTNLPASGIHNGGNIAFGPDGKLYHSMGDNASSGNSQSATVYPGKIHRFNDDGTIPADNPYSSGMLSRYCMGLRNSFDLCWNHTLGLLYASENGPGTSDEANRISAGGNYGWPTLQCTGNATMTAALTCWTPTIAPTGITAYEATQFGAEYLHDLFMCDFNGGTIWRLDLSPDGLNFVQRSVFHDDTTSVYDVAVGLDGALYYTTESQLKRIRRLMPVTPPSGMSCTVQGEDVLVTWTNQGSGTNGDYADLQVRVDGLLVATIAGDQQQYVHVSPAGGPHTYDVRGRENGNQSDWVSCAATVPVNPVAGLVCELVGSNVQLSWTNGESYDALLLQRGGSLLIVLVQQESAYLDLAPPVGPTSYEVIGSLGNEFSPAASCSVQVLARFIRGDCNGDGGIDVSDAIRLLNTLFAMQPAPLCLASCDMNDDDALDIADAIAMLAYLFSAGPGSDACLGDDSPLGCLQYMVCP